MAEFTHVELQKARKSRNMTQWQLANAIHVSEEKIKRWESGKVDQKPTPDEVSDIEHALSMEKDMLWHRWMYSNCESYRERHLEPQLSPLLNAIVLVELEYQDVLDIMPMVKRDVADGRFDDLMLKEKCITELKELKAAVTNALGQLGGDG